MKKILHLILILLLLPINVYAENGRVFFHKNDGDETFDSKVFNYDGNEMLDINFTKEGHVLAGWAHDPKADVCDYDVTSQVPEEWNNGEDIHLYAVWKPIGSYGNIIAIGDFSLTTSEWTDKLSTELESPIVKSTMDDVGFVTNQKEVTFETLFENASERIDQSDGVEYVIVLGGYNDRTNNEDEVVEAISNFEQKVHSKFPAAKLMIGMIGCNKTDISIQEQLKETASYYKKGAELIDALYIIDNDALYNKMVEIKEFVEDDINIGQNAGEYLVDTIKQNIKPIENSNEALIEEDIKKITESEDPVEEIKVSVEKPSIEEGTTNAIEEVPELSNEKIENEPINEKPEKETLNETPKQTDVRGKFFWTLTLLDKDGNLLGTKIVEDGGTATDMPKGFKQSEYTNVHGNKTLYQTTESNNHFSPPNTADKSNLIMWSCIFGVSFINVLFNGYILKKYAR